MFKVISLPDALGLQMDENNYFSQITIQNSPQDFCAFSYEILMTHKQAQNSTKWYFNENFKASNKALTECI